MPKILEVIAVEPLAMSPDQVAAALSISRRRISLLIADGSLTARKDGVRTLVDYQSVRDYYASLPRAVGGVSIPNSPQALRGVSAPARRRKAVRS